MQGGGGSGLGSCGGGAQLADYVGGGVGALSLGAAVVSGGASGGPLELKTSFCTREGEYRLLAACEYGHSNRATAATGGYNSPQTKTPVKVSFIEDKLCYNVGRELYIYTYRGAQKAADLSKPVDKKVYKGSFPTCHDFNQMLAAPLSLSPSPSPSASTARTMTPAPASDFGGGSAAGGGGAGSGGAILAEANGSLGCAHLSDEIMSGTDWGPGSITKSAATTTTAAVVATGSAGGGMAMTGVNSLSSASTERQTASTPTSSDDVEPPLANTPSAGSPPVSGENPPSPSEQKGSTQNQGLQLLVGFSGGQIQIIDPVTKDHLKSKLFNDERLIEKTKVTCLAWVPYSTQLFVVSHTSGQLYLYKSDLPPSPQAPHYQLFKTGPGFTVHTCRSKQTRNPLFRWVIGEGSINEFAFSPGEGRYLATVSQDGVMRCFDYSRMELVGSFRSYFGGLICVAWSPDGKYVLAGGEDDLVTLWSVAEKRVVARGQGHNSWVNCVQFDPFLCGDGGYRFGSVGQDTQLCLWDVSEADLLKQPKKPKKHSSCQNGTLLSSCGQQVGSQQHQHHHQQQQQNNKFNNNTSHNNNSTTSLSPQQQISSNHNSTTSGSGKDCKEGKDNKDSSNHSHHKDKEHCNGGSSGGHLGAPSLALGSAQCPRLGQVPMLEPLVCKRVAPERLTALHFREDCLLTACQEGFVCTWARPGVRSLSDGVCERADFGMTVSAAYIDGDAPPSIGGGAGVIVGSGIVGGVVTPNNVMGNSQDRGGGVGGACGATETNRGMGVVGLASDGVSLSSGISGNMATSHGIAGSGQTAT
ncbi:WD repeat-containing protein 20-like isoform X1 [Varroa jacobsoni]|uniref:WD repeat-containing protein 20-like isoform X1 n=1 Tax=Varroa jacobsoni TaxID=62625 RepID=UPI000BF877A8|nr:WD repeat-containing protein 20-like isoform X1 [Varroa jacobsoni]XP_022694159.1 WD repeat-containing protein 20-like isoform X1 [Varroa jacobsoni]